MQPNELQLLDKLAECWNLFIQLPDDEGDGAHSAYSRFAKYNLRSVWSAKW